MRSACEVVRPLSGASLEATLRPAFDPGFFTSWVILCLRRSIALCVQFLKKRPGIYQVSGVETFSEPSVDFGEQRARLIAAIQVSQQARKAGACAQLPGLGSLLARDIECRVKGLLGCARIRRVMPQ